GRRAAAAAADLEPALETSRDDEATRHGRDARPGAIVEHHLHDAADDDRGAGAREHAADGPRAARRIVEIDRLLLVHRRLRVARLAARAREEHDADAGRDQAGADEAPADLVLVPAPLLERRRRGRR